jgi:hypothetical protein
MGTGETHWEMAARHVAEQEERIARQEVLIERLRAAGKPTDGAVRFLASMQDFLETMRADLARLSNSN